MNHTPLYLLLVTALSASAATTFFDTRAAWESAAGGTVLTEDFGTAGAGAPTGSFDQVGLQAVGGGETLSLDVLAQSAGDGQLGLSGNADFQRSGRGLFFSNSDDSNQKTVTIDNFVGDAVLAFAFYGLDLFDTRTDDDYQLTVEFSTNGGSSYSSVYTTAVTDAVGGDSSGLVSYTAGTQTGTQRFGDDSEPLMDNGTFFGFTSDTAITNIIITHEIVNFGDLVISAGDDRAVGSPIDGSLENIAFDDLLFVTAPVTVPEPSSVSLLALSGLALLCRKRSIKK